MKHKNSNVFKFEFRTESYDILNNEHVHVVLTPEKQSDLLEQCEYAMAGIEIETSPSRTGEKCISFGGLLGRFKVKDPAVRNKWYLYVWRDQD